MNLKFIKIFTITLFILLTLIILITKTEFTGIIYKKRINITAYNLAKKFSIFIEKNVKEIKSLKEDALIRSAFIEAKLGSDLSRAEKQLNFYKSVYPQFLDIILLLPEKIPFLKTTTNITPVAYIINNERVINNAEKNGYGVSKIFISKKENKLYIGIVEPVKNILNETMGYIIVFVDFTQLLIWMKSYPEYRFYIFYNNKINFTNGDKEKEVIPIADVRNTPFSIGIKISEEVFKIPLILWIAWIFSLIGVLFIIYNKLFWSQK